MANKHYGKTIDKDLMMNDKHWYFYKGEYVPGVTTVIGKISDKTNLIYWAVNKACDFLLSAIEAGDVINNGHIEIARKAHTKAKEEAADIGKTAHDWIEQHIKGGSPEMPDDPRVLNAINAFLKWEDVNKVKYLGSEMKLYSLEKKVAGTADVLAKVNGKLTLIDNKTANGIYDDHKIQACAYADMYEEMNDDEKVIEEIHIIRLGKEDGNFHHEVIADQKLRGLYISKFELAVKNYYIDKALKDYADISR